MVVLFSIPSSSVCEFQLPQILTSTWYNPFFYMWAFCNCVTLLHCGFHLNFFNDVEHIFLCLLGILPWSVRWNLLPVFFVRLLSRESFIYSGFKYFIRYVICKYFLPVCGLYFHIHQHFQTAEILNFDELQLIYLFYYGLCIRCCI